MKTKIAREIALLCAPVALLGAIIWVGTGRSRMLLPAFLKADLAVQGPIRVEFSPLQPIKVMPYEAAQGFDWAGQTTVQTRGHWDAPAGWKIAANSSPYPRNCRLVFRRGKKWQQAPWHDPKQSLFQVGFDGDSKVTTLRIRLKNVPRDAEEVRLRGEFNWSLYYSGAIPPGWKAPKNLSFSGGLHAFNVTSKPFDFKIKGPNDPFPAPKVSRVPTLQLVSAGWFYTPNAHSFAVRLRELSGQGDLAKNGINLISYSLRDGNGKEIAFFDNDGKGARRELDRWLVLERPNTYPSLPQNEVIATVVPWACAPRGGWGATKPPLTLDAQISDGTSWPLRVRATLRQKPGDFSTLAQLPAPK